MTQYKAPQRDMRFVLDEMLNIDAHYERLSGCEPVTPDLREAILGEGAKFCEEVLSPLNRSGDEEGCTFDNGEVTTPTGFKEAYSKFVEGGWPGLAANAEYGGQGLPQSMGVFMNEMAGTSNWSWAMYPGLSAGAVRCIEAHGSEEQKQLYLTKLISGEWTGTMCLTEPHCGSDLGLLRTKAEANADGSYAITGTKIFISSGEHDLTDNIVHMVIARIAGAPAGTKGISLFIVPKFLPDANGGIGARNGVSCGSIEHKMGIKASATCVMNFDRATGFLVGTENTGLMRMFTMMNAARIGTAIQGLGTSELAFQGGVRYARERLQMRSLTGPKNPNGAADAIVVHPDVRRMLMTMKSITEGQRAFLYWLATLVDISSYGPEGERKQAEDLLAFLTPIAKGFCTETGFEVANHGVQIYGGHGFIREHGMEQIVRDSRISMLYEGTTGIQALDLLGRKVFGTGGEALNNVTRIVHKFCQSLEGDAAMKPFVDALQAKNKLWGDMTMALGAKAMENADEVGAASVDFLMYSGYVILAFMWARAAKIAQTRLAAGTSEEAFYKAKLQTAEFYFQKILPRADLHATTAQAGSATLMALSEDAFIF
jgi:alkylation response protein AidB-like acyl-CoA dehydrogenase